MNIKYIDRKSGEVFTETPPAEGLLKFLYDNPFGKTAILPIVKRKFLSEIYGRKMDSPSSIKNIQPFIDNLNIDMSESKKSIEEFESFNDFFYRKLNPNARPIGEGIVSPGDGRILAFNDLNSINSFFIKGREFKLSEFLQDKELAKKYEGGTLVILRLAPNDYHRFHFPFNGTPSPIKKIRGSYFSVSPYALASNFTKVFCENKREICTLNTQNKGDLLIIPIGATMVGSIIETYKPNEVVGKGDEMGFFAFGGSTVVLLAESGKLTIDEDILVNTVNKMETFVKMGEQIGS